MPVYGFNLSGRLNFALVNILYLLAVFFLLLILTRRRKQKPREPLTKVPWLPTSRSFWPEKSLFLLSYVKCPISPPSLQGMTRRCIRSWSCGYTLNFEKFPRCLPNTSSTSMTVLFLSRSGRKKWVLLLNDFWRGGSLLQLSLTHFESFTGEMSEGRPQKWFFPVQRVSWVVFRSMG